jgi:uncharacterized delta-60 repeat protein
MGNSTWLAVVVAIASGCGKIAATPDAQSDGAMPDAAPLVPAALDPNFGTAGVAMLDFSPQAIAVQPDGKAIVVGSGNLDVAVARLTLSGALDTTFGNGGVVRFAVRDDADRANAVALQADGKILVAGEGSYAAGNSSGDAFVARLTSAGALDSTFGTGGRFIIDLTRDGSTGGFDYAQRVVAFPDGKIVFAARVQGKGISLLALTAAGALDATFGRDGVVTYNEGELDVVGALLAQSDGKIVIAGTGQVSGESRVRRVLATGSPDPSFGSAGVVKLEAPPGTSIDLSAAQVQPDGSLLLAGMLGITTAYVARRLPTGAPDLTFDDDGFVIVTSLGKARYTAVTAESGGAVYAVGSRDDSGEKVFASRFTSAGGFDTAFGDSGSRSYPEISRSSCCAIAPAVAFTSDGRALITNPELSGSLARVIRVNR